ncbi:9084_t:CDS:2 [Funneliformis mosseae]|uniref:9084_t:CDS:1 n=1 Tax=Funneliformis mosseae TaxID=27381 RepID=A0A9N9GEE0_FUNMO|nr:9084_t:CDS:2 [Funneliformis mosseae]
MPSMFICQDRHKKVIMEDMESRTNKRVNEPKHLRRKVVFVDPDDPEAPHWWPALVVPLKEIEIFKQRMDYDVQYPAEGENVVCYFEDGSFSIVPEKDQLPFDPKCDPYTKYMEGPNASSFQKDKAVTLATLYFEKGIIPQSFKWLHKEDNISVGSTVMVVGSSGNGINANHQFGSDGPYINDEDPTETIVHETKSFGNTKRHARKDSSSNVINSTVIDHANVNKKDGQKRENGGTTQRKNSIGGPTRKNSGPIAGNPTSRTMKAKHNKTSGNTRQLSANFTTKHSSVNQSINHNNLSSTQSTKSINFSTSATTSISFGASNPVAVTERISTTSRIKACSQCGEKASSAKAAGGSELTHTQSHGVLCSECGELMNSLIIKDGDVVMENDQYFKHFIEKKRRQPERLWSIKDVEKVEMSILYGKLPVSKRQRWLDKSEVNKTI